MDWSAIRTRRLRKSFGAQVAVEDLTLEVARGEVFGFLGPNGAGKSTSVKMLLGLVRPSGGEAWLLGQPAGEAATRNRVGFLPEHFHFQEWLTGEELLSTHGRLYGMEPGLLKRRTGELLDLVGLAGHRSRRISDYSKGMRQRIGLAQALLNRPELIFLDEPTSGLDPAGRLLVRDIIRGERERGAAVFLNSHLLGEVELTCDRVGFIRGGRVLGMHELDELASAGINVRVKAEGVTPAAIAAASRWADVTARDGSLLELVVADEEQLPAVLRSLVESGASVYEFSPRRANLEEIFLEIVGSEGGL